MTDGPAADRYTEAKISQIGMKMLECMDVADYIPNYTGEFKEPIVLTTRLPNFFINECSGIAVGLNCNIPAHNLKEIVEGDFVVNFVRICITDRSKNICRIAVTLRPFGERRSLVEVL